MSGRNNWPGSLVWSAYALVPWLILFEWVKRREWESDRRLPLALLGLLLLGTAATSISAEIVNHELLGRNSAPLGLQLLRRLPAIAVTVLLFMLSRREQENFRRGRSAGKGSSIEEAETLRRHAPNIRWIRAADNYLELHLEDQVWMRRATMRDAGQILEPLGFVRIHRSVTVNRRYVAAIVPGSGGPRVRMADGTLLPTGRAFVSNLRQLREPLAT